MPTATVRQLEDDVYQSLKAQAESSGRSMEAEVRDILATAVRGGPNGLLRRKSFAWRAITCAAAL